MKNDYEVGIQPCDKFDPKDGSMPGVINEHECPICLFTRSSCKNCGKDHHYKGWDLHDKVELEYKISYQD